MLLVRELNGLVQIVSAVSQTVLGRRHVQFILHLDSYVRKTTGGCKPRQKWRRDAPTSLFVLVHRLYARDSRFDQTLLKEYRELLLLEHPKVSFPCLVASRPCRHVASSRVLTSWLSGGLRTANHDFCHDYNQDSPQQVSLHRPVSDF